MREIVQFRGTSSGLLARICWYQPEARYRHTLLVTVPRLKIEQRILGRCMEQKVTYEAVRNISRI